MAETKKKPGRLPVVRDAFLDLLRRRGSLSVEEIAERMDIPPNNVYQLAKKLLDQGLIQKNPARYQLVNNEPDRSNKPVRGTRRQVR